MELIKESYDDDSVEDDSPVPNVNIELDSDFFGLRYNNSDDELNKSVEKDLSVLRETQTLLENSSLQNSSEFGPRNHTRTNMAERNVEKYEISLEKVFANNKNIDDETRNVDSDSLSCTEKNNICWEEALQVTFRQDSFCRPPNRCIFSQHLADKCLTCVQWNSSFSNLLLSTSLDGCVRVWNYSNHSHCTRPKHKGGAKAGIWSLDGRLFFSGGFDKCARLTDLVTGQELLKCSHNHLVTSVQVHPSDSNLFLSGSFNKVCAWDARSSPVSPCHTFPANCKQVLCMAFLPGGEEFVCSTEVVSRDSADRTIMVWDFASGTLFSNQIYQERFICPWLVVDHERNTFLAQSSGNYIAEFSALRPYKMNKYRRYEGHTVSAYGIGCCLSKDSSLLASGDSEGCVYIYRVGQASLVRRLPCPATSCGPSISLDWHPQLASLLAVGTWDGYIHFWK